MIADIQEKALHSTGNELRGTYSSLAAEDHVIDLTNDGARKELIAKVQAGEREVVGVCNVAGLISTGRFDAQPPSGSLCGPAGTCRRVSPRR